MSMDNKDIEKLYEKYSKQLYRYAYFKLNHKEKAEDVLNETFSRLISNPTKIRAEKRWIFGICNNVIKEEYREKYEQEKSVEYDEKDFADINSKIESIVLDEETKRMIYEELRELPGSVQEILVLKIWEELKFEDISKITKLTLGNVKMKYYRGLKDIKKNLKDKKDRKMFVIGLPAILLGIKESQHKPIFKLDDKFNFNNMQSKSFSIHSLPIIAKIFIPISLIVISTLIIFGIRSINDSKQESELTPTPTEIIDTTTPTPIDPYQGWSEYVSLFRNIKFKYPSNIKISEDSNNITLSLTDNFDSQGNPMQLIIFSNSLIGPGFSYTQKPTGGDITVEMPPIIIEGKEYKFIKYALGEGTACGGDSIADYSAELTNELYFNLLKESATVRCDAKGNQFKEPKTYATRETDIVIARKIAESVNTTSDLKTISTNLTAMNPTTNKTVVLKFSFMGRDNTETKILSNDSFQVSEDLYSIEIKVIWTQPQDIIWQSTVPHIINLTNKNVKDGRDPNGNIFRPYEFSTSEVIEYNSNFGSFCNEYPTKPRACAAQGIIFKDNSIRITARCTIEGDSVEIRFCDHIMQTLSLE